MDYLATIENYQPTNEQEKVDKQFIIDFIKNHDDCLYRTNKIAHLTASSWIVNQDHTKVLMVYHKIYDSWSWTGGHCDGDGDFLRVALKEAMEETGIKHFKLLKDDIYSLEVLTVNGHIKKGEYLNSHLHLNVTYLLEASDKEELILNDIETKGVKWFALDDALKASTEPWFVENIYKKLNNKLNF